MPASRKWREFDAARVFVRSLGLSSQSAYIEWSASGSRPDDIPSTPSRVYADKWINWSDWLGTNRVRNYCSYSEARSFMRALALSSYKNFIKWRRSDAARADIPAAPDQVYKFEWTGWGDFLGHSQLSTHNRKYKGFKDARAFVRSLELETAADFKRWSKSGDRPLDIPGNPSKVYQESWVSWADFLGSKNVSNRDKKYLPFVEARAFVRSLGLKNQKDFAEWSKSTARPSNIPSTPARVYGAEFKGLGDWIGSNTIPPKDCEWMPYAEAKAIVQAQKFSKQSDFHAWKPKPLGVPSNPQKVYKEWESWGVWLGTGVVSSGNKVFLPFQEARTYVRGLGFTSLRGYQSWAKTEERPSNIPSSPADTYQKNWVSWPDFLGIIPTRWTRQSLIGFLKALVPLLGKLEPSELFAILKRNNCINALDSLGDDNPLVMITKAALGGDQLRIAELSAALSQDVVSSSEIDDHEQEEIEAFDGDDSVDREIVSLSKGKETSLPTLTAREILDALDEVSTSLGISDEETINFLIDKGVSRLWQSVLSSTNQVDEVEKVRRFISDTYAQTIRNRFVEEFDAVEAVPLPVGYAFRKSGQLVKPNLMQRLIAHRLISRKRVGNWSGTGAGKTLAAILGSRVVDSDLTLVIALNNTISDPNAGWALEIKSAFPSSHVQIKDRGVLKLKHDAPNYLLLNYESFQLSDSRSMVEHLVNDHKIDLIVLDEIHSAKSRNTIESKRRQLLNYLITEAGHKNSDLRVLGMSATPVVNSLDEAASLLEMIASKDYSDLDTQATIVNALGMHQQLILNGVRYRPDYKMELHEEAIEIKAEDLTDRILNLRKGDVLGLENILLESKLPVVLDLAIPGTIIFSNFVEGIFDTVSKALREKGTRVARFSGEDKSGLEEFKSGRADVLVGSAALGTGVDGLQYICNRLIVITLPWTSAGYEQLLGRIYRQGSRFDRIEVFIPQVILHHEGQEWSWDKQRFGRIKYKKTLADAAVDGFVPEGKLTSQEKMFAEARKILESWISALEDGGELRSIERSDLKIPLPPETLVNTLRRYGDFSQMNARIGASNSDTTNIRFNENPEEWYHYHSLYREARKSWLEVPYVRIAEGLAKRPDWVVADFGCGEALLSKTIPNKVFSFDHVAIDESVTACDMRSTNLESESIDVAVFSLSLMGLNWTEYLNEAHRVLRTAGFIEIVEPASKWHGEKLSELTEAVVRAGFLVLGDVQFRSKFIYLRGVKG